MSIEFEAPKPIAQTQFVLKTVAEEMMRSRSRYFDEHEHEIPWADLAFRTVRMTLERYFEDRKRGQFDIYCADLR